MELALKRFVSFCRLDQVIPVRWCDLHIFGRHAVVGWESFSGHRIGTSICFEEIILVESSPVCAAGSIIAFGVEVAGPGGDGPNTLDGTLVLDTDFTSWLKRMAQDNWTDYGLFPGALKDVPTARATTLKQHFKRLNPKISWA